MGIQSAMYTGVSGLNINSQAMNVIGNNLANGNTLGYKAARSIFSDLLSSRISGSGGISQVGRGVGLSAVDTVFKQGTFESTSSDTDLAIEGDSFFVLKEPGSNTSYYSRAGAFYFNQAGYLVNPEGLRVQGYPFDPADNTSVLSGQISDIQVQTLGLMEARATSEMGLKVNLDEHAVLPTGAAINPADRGTYNYSTPTEVFDSLGMPHLVTVYWRLENDATNTWSAGYTLDNDPASFAALGTMSFDQYGNLPDIDANGSPDPFTATITLPDWGNGSEAGRTLDLSFDLTQYDSASVTFGKSQNGYSAGELTNVSIESDGTVVASYSNGVKTNVGQLVLAKFQSPQGLELAGSNRYIAAAAAGDVQIGIPSPSLGEIYTNSLEMSNVDMGQEFVRMITNQRGFQANSKIITTVDEMLTELINLKR